MPTKKITKRKPTKRPKIKSAVERAYIKKHARTRTLAKVKTPTLVRLHRRWSKLSRKTKASFRASLKSKSKRKKSKKSKRKKSKKSKRKKSKKSKKRRVGSRKSKRSRKKSRKSKKSKRPKISSKVERAFVKKMAGRRTLAKVSTPRLIALRKMWKQMSKSRKAAFRATLSKRKTSKRRKTTKRRK